MATTVLDGKMDRFLWAALAQRIQGADAIKTVISLATPPAPLPRSGRCSGPPKMAQVGGKSPFVEAGSPYLGAAGSRESKVFVHRNPSLATSPST